MNANPMHKHENVVCPGCACVCDDLSLAIENNQLVTVEPECPLASKWFHENSTHTAAAVFIEGAESSLEKGISRAASILRESNYPLVFGLSRSSTPGQRAAVELADRIGAVIDTTASLCHGPSIMALQNVGESTCSLGEIRNRSDLVIFWGCNPAETHPRHAERYSVFPDGQFLQAGRSDRTIIFIGDADEVNHWRLDTNGSKPDIVIPIVPGRDFEAIAMLRMLIQNFKVEEKGEDQTGAKFSDLQTLAGLMKACQSGAVFFGLGLTGTSLEHPTTETLGHITVDSLLQMVAELNSFTRFYARRMRIQGDVSGADSVLCWQTGYPFSVDLSRGHPRYNPGEFSANNLLERREPDACLLVGTETVAALSVPAQKFLTQIPTIVLDYPGTKPSFTPTIQFTTAPYGLAAAGTIYRMDETPLTLKSYLNSPYPTDEAILQKITALIYELFSQSSVPISSNKSLQKAVAR